MFERRRYLPSTKHGTVKNLVKYISRREAWIAVIHMYVLNICYKNLIIFCGGQNSFGINSNCQIMKTCWYFKLEEFFNNLIFVYVLIMAYHMYCKSLLHLVESIWVNKIQFVNTMCSWISKTESIMMFTVTDLKIYIHSFVIKYICSFVIIKSGDNYSFHC